MKIIFWYWSVFNRSLYDLCYCKHLVVGLYSKDICKVSLIVIVRYFNLIFIYLGVYMSTHSCPSYFKAMPTMCITHTHTHTHTHIYIYIYIYEKVQRWENTMSSKDDFIHRIIFQCYTFRFFDLHLGTIYQPLRSGRIWHKVNFLSGV